MKKKCLVITFCYPPHQSPESFVTGKFINGISKYWDIDILSLHYEQELEKLWSNNNIKNIYRLNIPKIYKKILEIPRLPIRPDRFVILNNFIKKELNNINLKKYDIFFTRSQFHSAHFLGLHLKKIFPEKKWITSFSDPWVNNPYQKNIAILEYINNYFKEKILKRSDLLIFPLKNLKNHFIKYSNQNIKNKSIIVPHAFDSKLFPKKLKTNIFKVSFFGKIYADRNIVPLLSSIEHLKEKFQNLEASFYLDSEFINNNKKLIAHFQKHFKVRDYTTYSKYIKNVKNSSLLIVLDVDTNDGKYFFQSKLVDYLGSKNIILHIGKSYTYNKELILKNNCYSSLNNKDSIIREISTIIEQKSKFICNKNLVDSFELKKVASNFIKNSRFIFND